MVKAQLIEKVTMSQASKGVGIFVGEAQGYSHCADLDGEHAKKWLEGLGFEVVKNGDNGSYGYAVTACGLCLSTNGYIHTMTA